MANSSLARAVNLTNTGSQLISDEVKDVLTIVSYVVISPVLAVLGIASNIINFIIYFRHGVKDSVNISFLALAVSDLGGLISTLWYGIGVNPYFAGIPGLPFSPAGFMYITAAWPRVFFSKMICWVTVFITIERCLCIIAPLKVKALMTPWRTVLALATIFTAGVCINFPHLYLGALYLHWVPPPGLNRSVLVLGVGANYQHVDVVSGSLNTSFFLIPFVILIISTAVLFLELRRKLKWRRHNASLVNSKSASFSNRDRALGKTIVMLSALLIVSFLPYTANCIIPTVMEGFTLTGKHGNLYALMWSMSWVLETINASTDILIYYLMSSKYRATFKILFSWERPNSLKRKQKPC